MSKDKTKPTKKEISDHINKVSSEAEKTPVSEAPVNTKKVSKKSNENKPLISRVEDYINNRYEIRIDEVRNILEVKRKFTTDPFKKDEHFESNIVVELMRDGFKNVQGVVRILLSSNFVKKYHPIREYFNNLEKWDGVDRIKQLTDCITTTEAEKELFYIQFKKQLLRVIASAFIPDYFNKHCFVLVGTTQSMGKTSFIRYLMPEILKPYITDAVLDWKDKDANIALGCNLIINLDELANLNRDETNSLKATLSRSNIKLRRPYDRVESEIPRLASFFGSTNDVEFLSDLTGNVRFICFRIYNIDFKYSDIDIHKIWSQCFYLFNKNEPRELTREELSQNDKRNESFMITNPEIEAIQSSFIPAIKNHVPEGLSEPEFATTSELMRKLNEKGKGKFISSKKFGQALQRLGFISVSERDKYNHNPRKGYWYHEISIESN